MNILLGLPYHVYFQKDASLNNMLMLFSRSRGGRKEKIVRPNFLRMPTIKRQNQLNQLCETEILPLTARVLDRGTKIVLRRGRRNTKEQQLDVVRFQNVRFIQSLTKNKPHNNFIFFKLHTARQLVRRIAKNCREGSA